MISFFDRIGQEHPLAAYEDFSITHMQDGCDTMTFCLNVKHEQYPMLYEECRINTDNNKWLIKKIDDDKIECELDFDFLRTRFYTEFSTGSKLLYEVLTEHLPGDWSIEGAHQVSIRRTISFDYCTDYDVIYACMSTYKVYFVWRLHEKRLLVFSPDSMPCTGEYLTSELNLRSLSFKGDTTEFCTRLYCFGKDSATIIEDAMVDDGAGGKKRYGLPYVENFSYSDKVVCGYWSDDRYEDPDSMYADAVERLETAANPVRSYECEVIDLAKMSPEYSFLDFQMHRKLVLVDVDRQLRVEHQIVEYTEYPDESYRNKVTLSCVPGTIQKAIKSVISTAVSDASAAADGKVNRVRDLLNEKIMMATSMMTGAFGSYLFSANGELFMMDNPDPALAKVVWRWNVNGFAKSSTGIDGPYTTAILWNDEFITGIITSMVVNAAIVKTGILQSMDGDTFFLDLDNGVLRMKATSLEISGQGTVGDIARNAASDAAKDLNDSLSQSELCRRLTNDWKSKGIYMEGTELYINASYLRAGLIDLNMMRLAGTKCGLKQGFGMTSSGQTTEGIVMYGNGINNDGVALLPYLIVTDAGIRLQTPGTTSAADCELYLSGGYCSLNGDFIVHAAGMLTGNITADGVISYCGGYLSETEVWIGKNHWRKSSASINAYISDTEGVNIAGWSYESGVAWVGDGGGAHGLVLHGNAIAADAEISVVSDQKLKKDIEPLDGHPKSHLTAHADAAVESPSFDGEASAEEDDLAEKYEAVLDHMTPVRFRYKTESEDKPYHLGYIAQDVEKAIVAAGLDPVDMGTVRETVDEKGNKFLGIAYGELTALLHLKLKRQEERLAEQEKRIARLEALVAKLTEQKEVDQ